MSPDQDSIQRSCVEMLLYYRKLFGHMPPKFVLEVFESAAVSYVKWSEVQRRQIGVKPFMTYDLKPLLRVNIVLARHFVPREAVVATFIEEFIHLDLGWGKSDPHDDEFFSMALKCPEFAPGLLWKEQNTLGVIGRLNKKCN